MQRPRPQRFRLQRPRLERPGVQRSRVQRSRFLAAAFAGLCSLVGGGVLVGSAAGAPHAAAAVTSNAATTVAEALATSSRDLESDRDAARLSADWLSRHLSADATVEPFGPDLPDWGLTIDTMWALLAEGSQPALASRMGDQVAAHVADFATGDLWGPVGEVRFAGAVAKELLAAATLARDPADFGGYDVRAETLSLLAGPDAGSEVGRLRDRGDFPDSTNLFSQAIAIVGLARSAQCPAGSSRCEGPDGVPRPAVDFLLRQQCATGYFRLFYNDGLTCDEAGGEADTDATALAVDALITAGDLYPNREALDLAVDRALGHLERAQRADGSFGGGVSTPGSNANSTGLAAMVLNTLTDGCPRARATAYVRSVQVPRDESGTLANHRGAIAYDAAELAAARSHGAGAEHVSAWQRSTPQAMFAFLPVRLSQVGLASAPPSNGSCGEPTPTSTPTGPVPTPTPTPTSTVPTTSDSTTAGPKPTRQATATSRSSGSATAPSRPTPATVPDGTGPAGADGRPLVIAGAVDGEAPTGGTAATSSTQLPPATPPTAEVRASTLPDSAEHRVATAAAATPPGGSGPVALIGAVLAGLLAGVGVVAWQVRRR